MDKGSMLNKDVGVLFDDAGFEALPNSSGQTEFEVTLPGGIKKKIDLYATDQELGVRIVGSNKSGPSIDHFSDHIAGLEEIRNAVGANGVLLVAPGKEFSPSEVRLLDKKGIRLWGKRELSYYRALVTAIGEYAKYEIIHSFGIATNEQTVKATVPAIKLCQPEWDSPKHVELYLFTLPAETLLKTSAVLRRARANAFTYQRMLSKERLPRIGEFVSSRDALLPTNLVIHLSDSVEVGEVAEGLLDGRGKKITLVEKDHHLVTLTIPLEYASLEIIDGQHRLFGFIHAKKKTRERFSLIVVGIKELDEKRRSRTFVAINDKAKRVDPSLVSFLRYTDNERTCRKHPDLMAIKIGVELNNIPPFKDRIKLWDHGPQKITLKGICGYDLKGMVGPNGLLRRFYPNDSKAYVGVLRTYFTTLSELLKNEWKDPDRYIVATNRGVTAFLKLLKSILKTEQAAVDKNIAEKYLSVVRDNWIRKTWESGKLHASYTASQGWKQFHRDLVKSIRKQISSFKE